MTSSTDRKRKGMSLIFNDFDNILNVKILKSLYQGFQPFPSIHILWIPPLLKPWHRKVLAFFELLLWYQKYGEYTLTSLTWHFN